MKSLEQLFIPSPPQGHFRSFKMQIYHGDCDIILPMSELLERGSAFRDIFNDEGSLGY